MIIIKISILKIFHVQIMRHVRACVRACTHEIKNKNGPNVILSPDNVFSSNVYIIFIYLIL